MRDLGFLERAILVAAVGMLLGFATSIYRAGKNNERLLAQCVAERGAAKEYECVALLRGGGRSVVIPPPVVVVRR